MLQIYLSLFEKVFSTIQADCILLERRIIYFVFLSAAVCLNGRFHIHEYLNLHNSHKIILIFVS